MTESAKTITYVVIAALMAAAGTFLAPGRPGAQQDAVASMIGTEFYPEFTSPGEATSIDVIGYDAATAIVTPFSVKYDNGLWRIPTRHNYPADAKDRLAKVAASIIGLKREALAGRTEGEQAEFQVLDPQADKPEDLKGIGNRVTLKKGDTVLADYIIGKAVKDKAGYFYVRRPGDKLTFMAKVDLNLSTKFTDWIESDVLVIDGVRLTMLDIIKQSLEITPEGSARLVGQERNTLTREKSADPWKLADLESDTQEVDQEVVRKLVDALDNLKIVGVRPKPEALRKGLSEDEGLTLDRRIQADLATRGFFFQPTQRGGAHMISMEGDLFAGTDQGVEYELHFGDSFEGTTEEIEFDFAKPKDDAEQPAEGEKSADEKSAEKSETDTEKTGTDKTDAEKTDPEKSKGKKTSRYLFVTARVNPDLLGPEPVEPTKPEPPAETPDDAEQPKDDAKPADETDSQKDDAEKKDVEKSDADSENGDKSDSKADESSDDEQPADEKPTDEKSSDEKPADEEPTDAKPPEPPAVDPNKAYEEALKQYDADKLKYETDVKSRETKLKEAEEKVKTLNARFAEWYYVISAENFESLRPGRSTLVKEKTPAEKPEGETTPEGEAPADEPADTPSDTPKSDDEPEKDASNENAPDARKDPPPPDTPESPEPDDAPKKDESDTPE